MLKVRVISGTARGVKLDEVNSDAVRPTTDKVKESLFNIIQFDIEGKTFLDLFGGTGQMGIEAVSRGASKAIIVDCRRESIDVIKRNVSKSRLDERITVINSDAVAYAENASAKFDICFLDPPYGSDVLNKALLKLPDITAEDGIIITETPKGEAVLKEVERFCLLRQYNYGKISLNVYRNVNYL